MNWRRKRTARQKDRERRQQAVDKAQAALDKAEQEHAKRAAAIQTEIEAIEKRRKPKMPTGTRKEGGWKLRCGARGTKPTRERNSLINGSPLRVPCALAVWLRGSARLAAAMVLDVERRRLGLADGEAVVEFAQGFKDLIDGDRCPEAGRRPQRGTGGDRRCVGCPGRQNGALLGCRAAFHTSVIQERSLVHLSSRSAVYLRDRFLAVRARADRTRRFSRTPRPIVRLIWEQPVVCEKTTLRNSDWRSA